MLNLSSLIFLIITYYKIVLLLTFIYVYVYINESFELSFKNLNEKKNLFIILLLIITYFLIKPVLALSLILIIFVFITFMYKYFYLKIDLKMIKYKKIVNFYDFFINIFIYKYNLIFKRIYVVLNYNKYKNIGIRNKFNNIKNIVYNLIILYGLGISVLYINILIKTSVIISNNIDIYNKKLKKEKTIFVIFFLIYLDLKSYFNEKIYSANTINSNNTIANNLSKKNGFTENYIKQVLEMVRHQPQKIWKFPELKNKLDDFIKNSFTLNKKPTELNFNKNLSEFNKLNDFENTIELQKIQVLAGTKKKQNVVHQSLQIKTEEIKNNEYSLVEVYSTEKLEKSKIPFNTETLKGNSFNTSAELCIVNKDLIKKNKEFSEKFKENNNIQTLKEEQTFIDNRSKIIKKKILNEDLQIKVVEKEKEYVDSFKVQLEKFGDSVKELIINPSFDVRDAISKAVKDPDFTKKDPYLQNKVIDDIKKEINKLSNQDFKNIINNIYTQEELEKFKYIYINYLNDYFTKEITETKNNTNDIDNL